MSINLKAIYVASVAWVGLAHSGLAFEVSIPPVTTGGTGYLFPNSPSDLDRYVTNPDAPSAADSDQGDQSELRCDVGQIPQAEIEALRQQYTVQLDTYGKQRAYHWVTEATTQLFEELALEGLC